MMWLFRWVPSGDARPLVEASPGVPAIREREGDANAATVELFSAERIEGAECGVSFVCGRGT
jgi:hypothetical protein